jgi:hypothetical protein
MTMGSGRDTESPTMLESSCPEYYATTIGRIEPAGGDNLRIYMCVQRGRVLEPMFSVVIPIAALAHCARISMHAAADAHNAAILQRVAEQTAH